ncbi:hypothetical protein BH10BAC5_BH10BAC5_07330 [soil metagenome]
MDNNFNKLKFISALLIMAALTVSCSKISNLIKSENSLYFCESYDPVKGEIGKSDKFTTGSLTVMVDLRPKKEKIGVTDVDINITDIKKNEVISTNPYTVSANMDYIFFNNVTFDKLGTYKVSLLKKDASVVVSGVVEIVAK